MVNTRHLLKERFERTQFINNVIDDKDNVLCVNVIDRGHKNGPERFELTDKAVIKVYNNITNRHITDLIARPKQIYDRMGDAFLELSNDIRRELISLAREHQRLGYNSI